MNECCQTHHGVQAGLTKQSGRERKSHEVHSNWIIWNQSHLYGTLEINPIYGTFEINPIYGTIEINPIYGAFEINPIYGTFEINPIYGTLEINPICRTALKRVTAPDPGRR